MNGLYNMAKERYPGAVTKGKEMFDAGIFKDPDSTRVFYTFMSQLKDMVDMVFLLTVTDRSFAFGRLRVRPFTTLSNICTTQRNFFAVILKILTVWKKDLV